MNNFVKGFIFISIGAAVGSFATWRIMKRKYEDIKYIYEMDPDADDSNLNDEIDKTEKNKYINDITEKENDRFPKFNANKKELSEYAKMLKERGYISDNEVKEEKSNMDDDRVRIISAYEFGENPDYDTETFTHYADGVIEDQNEDIVKGAEQLIGEKILSDLDNGCFEEGGTIYIVNDNLERYFEIIIDETNYEDWQDDEYIGQYSNDHRKRSNRHSIDDD